MTQVICSRCRGNPHRYERGCVRCGDSGLETVDPSFEARGELPVAKTGECVVERARERVLGLLRQLRTGMEVHEKERVARLFVAQFAARPTVCPVVMLQRWTRAARPAVRAIVEAYAEEFEFYGRTERQRAGRLDMSSESRAAVLATAAACEEHVAWVRARLADDERRGSP
jgi:hypothetical protein